MYLRQAYEYDKKGQLRAVKDSDGSAVERYAYDAAGRMVREGSKTYRYGYLDKVLSVTDNDTTRTYTYHADGQLASATVGRGDPTAPQSETFLWDGLALIQRGDEQFINEPHVGGGNPVASSKGTSYFNDALGTTVGAKKDGKYSSAALSAFGEDLTVHSPTPTQNSNFFTGKPYVEGLGHAFLMRNYRAGLAKWQTADPLCYPDGWNQLAYCGNAAISAVDLLGCFPVSTVVAYAIESKLKDLINASTIRNLITLVYSAKPNYDIHIYGYANIQITNIIVSYSHKFSQDNQVQVDDFNFAMPLDEMVERTAPETYCVRHTEGDFDGMAIKVGDGTPLPIDMPGLSVEDSVLGYSITVTRISFDYNIMSDVHSKYLHYIAE